MSSFTIAVDLYSRVDGDVGVSEEGHTMPSWTAATGVLVRIFQLLFNAMQSLQYSSLSLQQFNCSVVTVRADCLELFSESILQCLVSGGELVSGSSQLSGVGSQRVLQCFQGGLPALSLEGKCTALPTLRVSCCVKALSSVDL